MLVTCLWALLLAEPAVHAQPRGRFKRPQQPQAAPPPIEFLGWDYAKLGYTLSPGEKLALHFRNNRPDAAAIPLAWELVTYAGEPLSQGQLELKLASGELGQVPISLPSDLKDGAYFVNYSLGETGRGGERRFHFDFRRPVPDGKLNLTIVALIENMDAEGWVRMMLGPQAPYVNVLNDWPGGDQQVDAAVVIAETMRADDRRLVRLKEYVEQGGKMLLFGKPAASLLEMLPVEPDETQLWREKPQCLRTLPGGPWQDFRPEEGPTRYGVRVQAKSDAIVLANWDDGSPAVVSWQLGRGRVVFVGAASGQEWQHRPSLEGADELALRLLYWMVRGEGAVAAMLDRAEQLFADETGARTAVRDRVLERLQVPLLSTTSARLWRQQAGRPG